MFAYRLMVVLPPNDKFFIGKLGTINRLYQFISMLMTASGTFIHNLGRSLTMTALFMTF